LKKEKPAFGGLSLTLFFALKNAYTHYRRITNAAGRDFLLLFCRRSDRPDGADGGGTQTQTLLV